jgi:patatin-like phospholipase/acyl hydrolase
MQDKAGPDFFDVWMPRVFRRVWWRKLLPLSVAKYSDEGLNAALQEMFDGANMGDAKRPLFVTAADLGSRTLKVYGSTDFDDARTPMWEVVRAATSAETYFNPWKGMADGGVFANNPSMVGVAASSRVLKVPLSELEVMSIGTGRSTKDGQREPRSIFQWGTWLVDALLTGASDDMHDYFVRSLPLKNYVRVQFLRDPDWKMDSPKDMDLAMAKWAPDITAATAVVRGF